MVWISLTFPNRIVAQSAATVPGSDAAYDLIQQLVELGVVPRVTMLERPLSRREVARIAIAADSALRGEAHAPAGEERARAAADALLRAYEPEVAELRGTASAGAVHVVPLASLRTDLVATNSLPRDVPLTNGVSYINAAIDPFDQGRWGRTPPGRALEGVETSHRVEVGNWLAVAAAPRLDLVEWSGGAARAIPSMHTGYVRARLRNVALQVGLDERSWGAGDRGGLPLSESSLPLPAITLSSDTAFRLPGVLGDLGPARITAMLADLGARQTFPHAKLAGYTLSFAPSDRVAFGVSLLDHMGGFGAPAASIAGRVADMFPFIDWLVRSEARRQQTNKLAGGDLRIRVPELSGTTFYWEFLLDDFQPKRLPRLLWDDTGELLGVDVARLTSDGTLSASVEYRRTSIRLYEHGQFLNGVTYRRTIVGDQLGPNAAGFYGSLRWRPSADVAVVLRPEYEQRNPSLYAVVNEKDFRFTVTDERPREVRRRVYVDANRVRLLGGVGIHARLGYEHVSNFGYLGTQRDQVLGLLTIQHNF